ncbi:hypothetical protein NAPIS_ORF00345, partial [Vairimorpha apis BRL 01]
MYNRIVNGDNEMVYTDLSYNRSNNEFVTNEEFYRRDTRNENNLNGLTLNEIKNNELMSSENNFNVLMSNEHNLNEVTLNKHNSNEVILNENKYSALMSNENNFNVLTFREQTPTDLIPRQPPIDLIPLQNTIELIPRESICNELILKEMNFYQSTCNELENAGKILNESSMKLNYL